MKADADVTEVRAYVAIQVQVTDGEQEPWVNSGERPADLDPSIRFPAPEKSWRAYVEYLNTRGTGNYRLVRRTEYLKVEVL